MDGLKKPLALSLAILAIMVAPMMAPTGGAPLNVPLGTWTNFPCGALDCSNASPTGPCQANIGRQDDCELLNSTLHRATYSPNIGSSTLPPFYIGFEVGCVKPAVPTTSGSVLYLQWANYSLTTYLNTTKFVTANTVGAIYIDNTNGWPCPGNLEADQKQQINSPPAGQGVMFRVVGICGCGIQGAPLNGGSPVLSYARVLFGQGLRVLVTTPLIGAPATTLFRWEALSSIPVSVALTVTAQWIATNQTSVSCGTLSILDDCLQSGSSSCTIPAAGNNCPSTTVTFTNAFTGTVSVTVTPRLSNLQTVVVTGGLSFFETDLKT